MYTATAMRIKTATPPIVKVGIDFLYVMKFAMTTDATNVKIVITKNWIRFVLDPMYAILIGICSVRLESCYLYCI
jgi:hypothetical protein